MNYLIPILVLGGLAAVVVFFLFLRKKKRSDDLWKLPADSRAIQIFRNEKSYPTPEGRDVFYEKGLAPNSCHGKPHDEGVASLMRKLSCASYPVNPEFHKDINIVVFASIPDSQGDPCFKEFIRPGNPYFGSQWDGEAGKGEEVDHYVKAAGQFIAGGEGELGEMIVIPYHIPGQEAHCARVTDYEMEHAGLFRYDPVKFEETKAHLTGGHPLIASCPGDPVALFGGSRYKADHRQVGGRYSCVLLTK